MHAVRFLPIVLCIAYFCESGVVFLLHLDGAPLSILR